MKWRGFSIFTSLHLFPSGEVDMPTRFWAFASFLLLTLLMGSGYSQPATQQSTFPTVAQLNRYGLTMAWWNQATINPSRDTVRHLTADEQVVYVQSSAGAVTAIDMETGRKLWAMHLGRPDAPSYPVTSNDELALVMTGLDLFALDKWTGNLVWRLRMPHQPSTSPVMDETQIYVGTLDGSVYTFNLKKIRELFGLNLLPQWSYQTISWRYKTSNTIHTPPIPWGAIVNFASENKTLYSVTKEGRDLKFQLETDAPISAPMTQSDGYLFMASQDFNVYAVNLINGKIRWQFVTGLPITVAPKAIGENLYVSPKRGGLYQLSTITGRQKWWQPDLVDFVAESQNYTFATSVRGDLVILDKETGGSWGTLPVRHFTVRYPNERTDRLIMATPSGVVMMIHERDQEYPKFYKNPDHRPILPEFATGEEPPVMEP
jgi:outer membrane protein assembly factor BamB